MLRAVTGQFPYADAIDTSRKRVEKTAKNRHVSLERAGHAYSRELVDVIFELPYCRIQNLIARKIAARQTASIYLKKLATLGVLEERLAGREKLFVHPQLMHLLTRDKNQFSAYE